MYYTFAARTANRSRLHADVRAIVHQHWHIAALAHDFERLQSGVIFQEFVNSTLLITMFVFQLKAVSGTTRQPSSMSICTLGTKTYLNLSLQSRVRLRRPATDPSTSCALCWPLA